MTLDAIKLLDDTGWRILRELQIDARLSFAELSRRVGLSLPAVAERVRRMEELGLIKGYHVEVNLARVGLPVMAFIQLNATAGNHAAIIALVAELPQVLECHHLTGTDSFIMKVAAMSMAHLETIITRLSQHGQTTTSIVLSSPVTERVIGQEASQPADVSSANEHPEEQ